MEKSFLYKGLLLIIMGIGLSSQCNAAAPDHDDASKSGDIIGQLSTCLGSNEGLRVYIAGTSFEAITDSLGNFKISYAQTGTYSLTVRRDGNEIGIIPNITVISKQTANIGTVSLCLDNDGDGYTQDVDCNDNNASIYPGAEEICGDGIDNNCNTETDEGCSSCTDADGDGYYTGEGCTGDLDCDDTAALINPGAEEVCGDLIDNNCNTWIDEGCTCDNDGGSTCETATMKGTICGDTGSDRITISGCGDGIYKFVLNECLSTTDQNLSVSVSLLQPYNTSVNYVYSLSSPCGSNNLGVPYEINDDPFTDESQEFYIEVHQTDGPIMSGDWLLTIEGNK